MTTIRRRPRTLVEAFPHDPRHAYAIERHRRGLDVGAILLAGAIGAVLAVALVAWWA